MAEIAQLHAFAAIVPVSAERGTQLPALKAEIAKALPKSPPLYPADDVTDRDERFLAAEFIREKIFRLLGEEVPYATTVAIDKFEVETHVAHLRDRVRRQGGSARHPAGRRRRALAIATQARAEMEPLAAVFLEAGAARWADIERSLTLRFGLPWPASLPQDAMTSRVRVACLPVPGDKPHRRTSPPMAASRLSRAARSGRARRCAGCCRHLRHWR
jgi:hypothetical protein